jgi:hypothetical protein
MQNKLVLFAAVILFGCSTVPVKLKFPEAPEELTRACGDLTLVKQDDHQFSNFLNVVVDNYGVYYECKIQADGWKRWYDDQRKIFNEAMQ